MNWTTRGDGHEHARYHGVKLRMRRGLTGWIISRREHEGWQFVAAHVTREDAERVALEVLSG